MLPPTGVILLYSSLPEVLRVTAVRTRGMTRRFC